MRRRDYLATAAILPTASIAGCGDILGSQEPGVDEGETHSSDSGVALGVQDSLLTHRLTTQSGETYIPNPGNLFLFIHIRSENSGDEVVSLALRNELRVVIGDKQFEPQFVDTLSISQDTVSGFSSPMSGDVYETVHEARPGVSSSGLLLFEVPRDAGGARLTWARQFVQDEPLYWDLDVDPDSVPSFEVQQFTVPEDAEYHSQFTIELVVENSGASGEFIQNIEVERSDETYTITEEIGEGETKTVTKTLDYPTGGFGLVEEATVSTPFQSRNVQFQTPTRDVGTAYVGPNGLSITPETVLQVDSATTEEPIPYQGPNEYLPESGQQLLLVEVAVENGDDTNREVPRNASFEMQTSNNQPRDISVRHPVTYASDESFIEPVQGEPLTQDSLQPGETLSGWSLYSVSSSVEVSGSYLTWTRDSILVAGEEPAGLQARWEI